MKHLQVIVINGESATRLVNARFKIGSTTSRGVVCQFYPRASQEKWRANRFPGINTSGSVEFAS